MDNYFKDIAQRIDNESYFDDAKQWYASKYLLPSIDRVYFLLLIAVCSLLILYCLGIMISFFPIKKSIPVTIEISDLATEYPQLIPLLDVDERRSHLQNSDTVVQHYLLKKYATARESYDSADEYALLEQNKRFVRAFSSQQLANQFERGLSIRNPRSPILRYRNHTTRHISIDKQGVQVTPINSPRRRVTGDGQPLLSYRGIVQFVSTEQSTSGTTRKKWNATIDFLYSPVTYSRESGDFHQMEFTVVNYQIEETAP